MSQKRLCGRPFFCLFPSVLFFHTLSVYSFHVLFSRALFAYSFAYSFSALFLHVLFVAVLGSPSTACLKISSRFAFFKSVFFRSPLVFPLAALVVRISGAVSCKLFAKIFTIPGKCVIMGVRQIPCPQISGKGAFPCRLSPFRSATV